MNLKLNKTYFFSCFLVFTLLIVYGCSSTTVYKNNKSKKTSSYYQNNKKGFKKNSKPLFYRVKKGDTLYSIAWEYGMDFKRLAWINRIKSPYVIKKNAKLRLSTKTTTTTKNVTKKNKTNKNKKIKKQKSKVRTKKKNPLTKKTKKFKQTKTSKNRTKKTNKKQKTPSYKKNLQWSWPIRGKIIQYFSPSKGKKGIDIAVRNKAKVRAAESGKVVYSGHGLTGYGHLIIVKHNNKYLSAYAHNSKLLVEEGALIKRKQLIAYSGKTSADRVKLHFEIRKNGKPVNPLNYLPKK